MRLYHYDAFHYHALLNLENFAFVPLNARLDLENFAFVALTRAPLPRVPLTRAAGIRKF